MGLSQRTAATVAEHRCEMLQLLSPSACIEEPTKCLTNCRHLPPFMRYVIHYVGLHLMISFICFKLPLGFGVSLIHVTIIIRLTRIMIMHPAPHTL